MLCEKCVNVSYSDNTVVFWLLPGHPNLYSKDRIRVGNKVYSTVKLKPALKVLEH